jgi:nucleoside-diphosphate-sugar epimerase
LAIDERIVNADDLILVTGAAGFIGARVVGSLLDMGFRNVRCLVRNTSNLTRLREVIDSRGGASRTEVVTGNLLSREDCSRLAKNVALVYHLAAGTGTKAFSDAFLNSVVTTRNLLDATLEHKCLRRFVNVSTFSVYTNQNKPRWRLLDESCPVEAHPESRAEAYCFGKVKQDELVVEYGQNHNVPFVIVRPGNVYGPGKKAIPGRIGIDTFGIYLNFGGSNPVPLTYVENCADAIVLTGLKAGIDGEVFNIVDDDLPSSRRYLHLYKRNVKRFKSIYVPHALSYLFCYLWEKYSDWSRGQLPPVFTRREWAATWKRTRYSNRKIKDVVGWSPKVPTMEGMRRFFESCRETDISLAIKKTQDLEKRKT